MMTFIKIGVLASFIFMIYMNYLANAKPLGGITTGEISDKYNTLFTPSGFTFSIWGIIYIVLLIFIGFFLINPNSTSDKVELLGLLFIFSSLLNVGWLLSWHFDKIILSTFIMIVLLITLLSILVFTSPSGLSYAAFSIYAGWISVALIANISILLFKFDISFLMNNQQVWLYIVLFISLIIGAFMVIYEKNYYYGAVFLWAYFGIAMKHFS